MCNNTLIKMTKLTTSSAKYICKGWIAKVTQLGYYIVCRINSSQSRSNEGDLRKGTLNTKKGIKWIRIMFYTHIMLGDWKKEGAIIQKNQFQR